jgi:hypothetical protein
MAKKKDNLAKQKEEVSKFIESSNWVFAKTYKDFAPHEYVVVKTVDDILGYFVTLIKKEGVDEEFKIFKTSKTYRYYHTGGYKYWVMGAGKEQPDIKIINRVKVE